MGTVAAHLADVGLVDAHTEGDCRHDDRRPAREEGHVRLLALGRRQRAVVQLDADAGAALREVLAHAVALRLRRRVHDRRGVPSLGRRVERPDEVGEVVSHPAGQLAQAAEREVVPEGCG